MATPRPRTGLHQPTPVRAAKARVELPQEAVAQLVAALDAGEIGGTVGGKDALHRFKLQMAKEHRLPKVPSDADLLFAVEAYDPAAAARHRGRLRMKATRTLSGVAIVTIQSSPERCPHGTCVFCPGGPDVGSAQSYTGEEPAALRAREHAFDAYGQTAGRLAALRQTGHDTDKVDLIIQGGTFPARDDAYQLDFVQGAFDAMNDAHLGWDPAVGRISTSASIDEAQARNETAGSRCIGLTVETKPDWWRQHHVDLALRYGATRVEMGVQTVFDDVLKATLRGHTVADTWEATQNSKDAGFKLVYHMMPGLPGSDVARDLESLRTIFSDPRYRPDMLKVYPTLVMPGTPLARLHARGEFEAITTDQAADLIAEMKRELPPYVRIQRVDRDIPTNLIAAGIDKSNLRQIALKRLQERYGETCGCIRCREVGHLRRDKGPHHEVGADVFHADELVVRQHAYEASGGHERFITVEDPSDGALFGYLRLRRLAAPWRDELQPGDAMIREVKVPGTVVPIGLDDETRAQHRGIGTRLVLEAARVAADEWQTARMPVIAGIGVKPYYRKLGFVDDGVYLRLDVDGNDRTYGVRAPAAAWDVGETAPGS